MHFSTYLLFFFFFSSNLVVADDKWEEKKNKFGITVYTRDVAGSEIQEFKALAGLNCSLEEFVALYEDGNRVKDWLHLGMKSELLKKEENKSYIYVQLSMPFMVTNRDFVFHWIKTQNLPDKVVYQTTLKNELVPLNKDFVRMNKMEGLWIIEQKDEKKIQITWQQHSEVGGSIPTWLANSATVDIPYHSIRSLEKLLAR